MSGEDESLDFGARSNDSSFAGFDERVVDDQHALPGVAPEPDLGLGGLEREAPALAPMGDFHQRPTRR